MIYLIVVSFIWAFSFGLIKGNLVGIDSNFVAFARLFISMIVFLPFLKLKNIPKSVFVKLFFIGAIQYGIMYAVYIYAYQFLKAYEVALFTIFTPIYITLINDILNRKFHSAFFLLALLSVLGAGIISYKGLSDNNLLIGFLLIQGSNICFAGGQIFYKKAMNEIKNVSDHSIFAILFSGASIVTLVLSFFTVELSSIILTSKQILTIIYLSIISSGLCFFLWNKGARLVSTATLAVFNNLKIPVAILVSLIVFSEDANIIKLVLGAGIILTAYFLQRFVPKNNSEQKNY